MNIYVGNFSYATTEDDLRSLFEQFGEVSTVSVIKDRVTGRSRGFGFVEMSSDTEGEAAINELNGKEHDGRTLKVNVAKERSERPPRRSGGYRQRREGEGQY